MKNSISELPKQSSQFLEHVSGRVLREKEWLPCPRCGGNKIKQPTGKAFGFTAAVLLIPFMLILAMIISAVMVVFVGTAGIVVGVGMGIGLLFAPFIAAQKASQYQCKDCSFVWTFADVDQFGVKQTNTEPDEQETSVRVRGRFKGIFSAFIVLALFLAVLLFLQR
jgi:preprotein translocase subunit SecY